MMQAIFLLVVGLWCGAKMELVRYDERARDVTPWTLHAAGYIAERYLAEDAQAVLAYVRSLAQAPAPQPPSAD